uniref:protein-tyrosine-phosphatase n=1 Tax=Crassostrea virginica TaxID=6565 RepID=A0A8B8BYJ4_CRAVI|nr:receptor-type tyrosine-protein phosphatase T-like [Crassostrea virginica]
MAGLTWLCLILCLGVTHGYENLSRRGTTILTQSSTYLTNNAFLANDGNKTTKEKNCAHTAPNHTKAWFQVDLGKPYNIESVTIYYRREGNLSTDWKQYRFRQFYLDASDSSANHSDTTDRNRCYTDNSTNDTLPPHIINMPCKKSARYIIVETKYDAPNDSSTGAILEICEIEVYGCSQNCKTFECDTHGECSKGCVTGFWRQNCSSECPVNCYGKNCDMQGHCSNCSIGYWDYNCQRQCPAKCAQYICKQQNGVCSNGCIQNWDAETCDRCDDSHYGPDCSYECSVNCIHNTCNNYTGSCTQGCKTGFYGDFCNNTCGAGCDSGCDRYNGSCTCKQGWKGETCSEPPNLELSSPEIPIAAVGAGAGGVVVVLIVVILVAIVLIRKKKNKGPNASGFVHYEKSLNQVGKAYTNLGSVTVAIEDPEEEPQVEKPEECVYYNDLTAAKDIAVTDLLSVITAREAKEHQGFTKEFKSLPYGERFPCDISKTEENMPKNRFKTTFPYDHSRVVLEISKENASDYINANYIENMEGNREFIACQGPRVNTVVDHWRMIWQEHITDIVMLTNLIEGPKIKCHQYWPDKGKELNADPFTISLLEEKVYAYYVIRKMALRKKKVSGSRTVTQFHYTRWPDHGTPNPLNLVVFLGHFRHKIRPSQHPILVHCSAGIGRTGTFIALDVLSRYGKDRGKINVIEYVKAMRKDRMTMIQNVDQYIFLYHALYEFFRASARFLKKDELLARYGNVRKSERKKQLTEEHNELINLKTKYEAKDFKTGKKYQKLNASKSVLPVERYLVFLTSNIHGREPYYNAVSLSSFKQAEEFVSAQLPVSGAAIDLARLLIDHDCPFIVSLTPFSEVKELKDWVNEDVKTVKMDPYEITKHAQTMLSQDIRRTAFKLKGKEEDIHDVQILECITWGADDQVPVDTSSLINLIKQLDLDRKSHPDGHVVVISRDGAAGCGVFFAVYNALQQLQQDEEVDLVTIVRQLQIRRPEMIATLKEYEFCVDAVCAFLASDNVYANT